MSQPISHLPSPAAVGVSHGWPTRHQHRIDNGSCAVATSLQTSLLQELARVSQDDKGWILLIAPPGLPVAQQWQAQGIDPGRVLVVHSPKIKNWQLTLERSLGSGHCAAVLTWLPRQISLDCCKLTQLGQRLGVLTHFFETEGAVLPNPIAAVAYGGQDIYCHH